MNAGSFIENLQKTRAGSVVLHVVFWLSYLGAIYYLQSIQFNSPEGLVAILGPIKQLSTALLVFYPLAYWVWPKFWLRKKYLAGFVLLLLLIIVYATMDFFAELGVYHACGTCLAELKAKNSNYYRFLNRGALNVIFVRLFTLGILYQLFVFLALPIAVKIIMEYLKERIKTVELQKENIRLEFNFLKAQVNPHFLFNTLNNIYALILKDKKEESAETVARLSTFLRYTLYESNTDNSNVVKEIDLLKAYISLEQIRLNDVVVNFTSFTDDQRHTLPPLLFMPVVENAFKFCDKRDTGDAYIFMKLNIQGCRLHFRIANTYRQEHHEVRQKGGIGLENFRKRLGHYFPGDRSSLEISDSDGIYTINVNLKLASP